MTRLQFGQSIKDILIKVVIRGILFEICQSEHTNPIPATAQKRTVFVHAWHQRLAALYSSADAPKVVLK